MANPVSVVGDPARRLAVDSLKLNVRRVPAPCHIGNGWFGGFLPATAFAIVAATGQIYSGLWYPVAIAAMSFFVALIFLPEPKDRDITQID